MEGPRFQVLLFCLHSDRLHPRRHLLDGLDGDALALKQSEGAAGG
jgi:hypothetical protein